MNIKGQESINNSTNYQTFNRDFISQSISPHRLTNYATKIMNKPVVFIIAIVE